MTLSEASRAYQAQLEAERAAHSNLRWEAYEQVMEDTDVARVVLEIAWLKHTTRFR